jgi:hypothetical protein
VIKKIIFPLLIIIALLAIIMLGVLVESYSYPQVIMIATNMFGNEDLQASIEHYLSIETFIQIKIIIICICIICAISIIIVVLFSNKIQQFCSNLFTIFWKDIRELFSLNNYSKTEKIFLFICIFTVSIHSIYYIHTWALQHDECWSYNYFIGNHILASFITPNNNHNLYTLLCWFANLILDGKWAMRLLALAGGLISIIVFAKYVKQYKKEAFFIIAIILFSASLPLLNYCISGRSYSFTILFAAIGLLCFYKMEQTPNEKKYYYYLAISQALGLFSNIGYLYPLVGFVLFSLLLITKNTIRNWLQCWALCGAIGIALLGIPLMVLHGIQPLQTAANTNHFQWQNIGKYCMICADSLAFFISGYRTGGLFYIIILSFCMLVILLFNRKQKDANNTNQNTKIYYLYVIQTGMPFVFFSMQQSEIFPRMFTYQIVFITIIMVEIIFRLIPTKNTVSIKWIYALLFLFPIAFYGFTQHVLFRWSAKIDKAAEHTATYLLSKKIDTCYSFYFYPIPSIMYQYNANKNSIYFIKSNKGSISYQAFDSTKYYPCILSASEDSILFAGYKKTVIDGVVDVWEKKKLILKSNASVYIYKSPPFKRWAERNTILN